MKRECIALNNNWKFKLENVEAAYYQGFDDSDWETVTVPHDWSVTQPFSKDNSSGTGYLPGGIGWYRTHFDLPKDIDTKTVTIIFNGVYNNSQVFVNSNNLGKRPYGYTTFSYDISDFAKAGDNVVSVCVKHTNTADSRWFTGSGIYRNVTVEIKDKVSFERYGVFVKTVKCDNSSAEISVDWKASQTDVLAKFSVIDKDGKAVIESEKTSLNDVKLSFLNPKLWSPDSPSLYTLHCELFDKERLSDQQEITFAVRSAEFNCDDGFKLNGVETKLKGVCLHHDAGVLGAAVPKNIWRRRLNKLKDMGCNAIRTSHNPPDPNFLDLCDEMGFLVMDEAFDEWEGCKNKWWQGHNVYPPKHYGYSEDFPVFHEKDLSEMVCRDRNHPSIILWSIGNEIDYPNDPYCSTLFKEMVGNNDANKPAEEMRYDPNKPDAKRLKSIAKELVEIVKKHDTSRPVTSAVAFPELSNQIGYPQQLDVVGYNYKEHLYDEDHKKYKNRILLGSENGHATSAWMAVKENKFISGQFLWTGIDYMGEAMGWPVRVATPGLLTMAGFEKPEYYHRKAYWSDKLFCKLATLKSDSEMSVNKKIEAQTFSWNYNQGEKIEVSCFTNALEAELFLNEKSLGKLAKDKNDDGVFTWMVPFENGELLVKAGGEKSVVTDKILTTGEPVDFTLSTCEEDKNSQVKQIKIKLIDKDGNLVTYKDESILVDVNGAKFKGSESGAPDDLISYTEKARKTFRGNLIAYVQKESPEKTAKVKVSMTNGMTKEITL